MKKTIRPFIMEDKIILGREENRFHFKSRPEPTITPLINKDMIFLGKMPEPIKYVNL